MTIPVRPNRGASATPLRRWVGYGVLVVVFAIACVLLSKWQFARLDEVRAQIQLVDQNYDAAPVPLRQLLSPGQALSSENEWRPVTVTGVFDSSLQVLVRNRTHDGVTGFDIISPLRDQTGSLFVVDRGWIPTAEDGRSPSAIPPLPTESVTVTAHLRETEPVLAGQSDTATLISSIHVVELAANWGGSVYTGAYGLLITEDPAGTNGVLSSKPSISEGNHLSYALQWIAFAILGFVALLWAIRHERRARSGKAPTRPAKKRKLSDSDIEDALLDAHRE